MHALACNCVRARAGAVRHRAGVAAAAGHVLAVGDGRTGQHAAGGGGRHRPAGGPGGQQRRRQAPGWVGGWVLVCSSQCGSITACAGANTCISPTAPPPPPLGADLILHNLRARLRHGPFPCVWHVQPWSAPTLLKSHGLWPPPCQTSLCLSALIRSGGVLLPRHCHLIHRLLPGAD